MGYFVENGSRFMVARVVCAETLRGGDKACDKVTGDLREPAAAAPSHHPPYPFRLPRTRRGRRPGNGPAGHGVVRVQGSKLLTPASLPPRRHASALTPTPHADGSSLRAEPDSPLSRSASLLLRRHRSVSRRAFCSLLSGRRLAAPRAAPPRT
jgi:hypothetical protein